MQPEKKIIESSSVTSGHESASVDTDTHFVFVANEAGIYPAFELIKSRLRNGQNSCLSLIYSISSLYPQPLFVSELESLERRYPSQLINYYLFNRDHDLTDKRDMNQQILEIVINCNICESMQFMILGDAALIELVTDRLRFLGVHPDQISSQII